MVPLTKELSQLNIELCCCAVNWPRLDRGHNNLRKSSKPFSNEFQAPVATDSAPPGTACDWYGQTAERRLTAPGESLHNKTGGFCGLCS